jgi:rhodanese-related sulfurtransferase
MTNDPVDLTPHEVAALLARGEAVLVDVREAGEYAAARIKGAELHPLSQFDPALLPAGRVVFQCGVGKRSHMAAQRALAAGLPHAEHLQGGLQAWVAAGLPVERG